MPTRNVSNCRRSVFFRFGVAIAMGLGTSSAHPVGIILAIAMPALALRQENRPNCYCTAFAYYAAAIWPVAPGARNFFGPSVTFLGALALWVTATALLALPWAVVWSPKREHLPWRAVAALAASVVPPLGIIGWASPLTGAGFLFPASGWIGFLGTVACSGLFVILPKSTAVFVLAFSLLANAVYLPPQSPSGWVAIDTQFGGIAHTSDSPIQEYQAAEAIQSEALSSDASVVIFPEAVVPLWTSATDGFWERTIQSLRRSGKTIVLGAKLVRSSSTPKPLDFSTAIAALRSGTPAVAPTPHPASGDDPANRYFNSILIRGAATGSFQQRIPVPVAMWNPVTADGAPLNLCGPGTITLRGERVAVLICYEQLLTWPVLLSMSEHPTVIVAVANDYWAAGTSIPRFQQAAVAAWARLFHLPILMATNT